jgi:DNA (cytosine-5)-methyltransferase 1
MRTFIDLFAGIGSFHRSLTAVGFTCVAACEINEAARETYLGNYNIRPHADIRTFSGTALAPVDIVTGGFPCQPFSQAGRHRGLADTRGTLFFELMRVVREARARVVLLENVPAILSHDGGRTWAVVQRALADAGYLTTHAVLKACDHGTTTVPPVPQMRRRLFVVAAKPGAVRDLAGLLAVPKMPCRSLREFLGQPLKKPVAYTIRCGGRRSRLGSRHNWDGYETDDGATYRLTLDDCVRLQGFDGIRLRGSATARWRMLGNTIPTNLTRLIAERVADNYTVKKSVSCMASSPCE